MALLFAVTTAVVVSLVVDGFSYYTTSLADRPRHEDYRLLYPAGLRGLGFGVVGTVMMLLLLLYSVRKRTRLLSRAGSPAKWLNVHIYFGVFGPIFITLHTTFKVTGLVAVAYWSMVAVALSGIFGRYLYKQIPRNLLGGAKAKREVDAEIKGLDDRLTAEYGLAETQVAELDRIAGVGSRERGRWGSLRLLMGGGLTLRRRIQKFMWRTGSGTDLGRAKGRQLEALLRERVLLRRRLLALDSVQSMFHYWHVIHKPFAYVMLVVVIIHVGVSIAFGYTWIF